MKVTGFMFLQIKMVVGNTKNKILYWQIVADLVRKNSVRLKLKMIICRNI